MSFWIAVVVLLALALAILLVPLMRTVRAPQTAQRQQQNIQIAREKKQQLQSQLDEAEIDQATYDSAYIDLQTGLALELGLNEAGSEKSRGKWMAMVVLLAVPAVSVSLYLAFGEYRVIENPQLVHVAPQQNTAVAPQMSIEEMTVAINKRLQENPEDAEGWFMLGKTMMARQQ
jgi:cytochrome c-type biogenesis protein CcmH